MNCTAILSLERWLSNPPSQSTWTGESYQILGATTTNRMEGKALQISARPDAATSLGQSATNIFLHEASSCTANPSVEDTAQVVRKEDEFKVVP